MRRTALVPLIALVALAGCARSGDAATVAPAGDVPTVAVTTTGAGAPATLDPCALVSREEAEALAGTPLEPAKPVRETCTYTGPVTGPTAQVEVFVGDGAKKFLDIERQLGHQLRPLPGVGDEAYASDEAVWVHRSGVWVSVRLVRLNDPAENRTPLEKADAAVASRM